jgi:hypothetical protein
VRWGAASTLSGAALQPPPLYRLRILPMSTLRISERYRGLTPCAIRSLTIWSRMVDSLASSLISSVRMFELSSSGGPFLCEHQQRITIY